MILCIIRPYSERDSDDYANTLLKTWPCDNIQEARENVIIAAKRIRESKNEELWVAEVEGRAVGFLLVEFTRAWGHKGEAFDQEAVGIDWFDINPEFQGKGISKQLLAKAEERGRARGEKELALWILIAHVTHEFQTHDKGD